MSETKTYQPLPTVEQFLKDYAATGLTPAAHKTLTPKCGCPLGAYAQARANEGGEDWEKAVAAGDIIELSQDKFGMATTGGFINGFDYPSPSFGEAADYRPRNDLEWVAGREHGKAVNAAVFGGIGSPPAGDG